MPTQPSPIQQLLAEAKKLEELAWRYRLVVIQYRQNFPQLARLAADERARVLGRAGAYRQAAAAAQNLGTTPTTPTKEQS